MPPPECTAITWRFLPVFGRESCLLHGMGDGWGLGGYLVREEAGTWQIGYRIRCDRDWRTIGAEVEWWRNTGSGRCRLARDQEGNWIVNDEPAPDLLGCIDIDLGFSPATNTLPIRRLELTGLTRGSHDAAWLRFPELTVERLGQRYTKIADGRWRYESDTGFEAVLEVNGAGLVTRYPGLWESGGEASSRS